jgi:septal ring factor EnvC (AmiA/AmiB activator)
MKQLEKDLNAVLKELKALTRKTEGIEKKLSKLEKTKAPKKAKAKARVKVKPAKKKVAKKTKKATAIDTILGIISKSKKGVNTATLKKKTGFDNKKIHNVINRLKQQGKVKSAALGVYVKI